MLHYSEVSAALRRIDSGTSLRQAPRATDRVDRRATPDQFDLKTAVWTVPAESMKMSREHRVPLSRQAVAVVQAARARNGSEYLFHGRDAGMLGVAAISQALRRADIDATPHGFRSSFKDWRPQINGSRARARREARTFCTATPARRNDRHRHGPRIKTRPRSIL